MAITYQDESELEEFFKQYRKIYKGRIEDYFAPLYLRKVFRIDPEMALQQVSFGRDDFGMDAFHFDAKSRIFHIYQFKWSENAQLFKSSMIAFIDKGMSVLFDKKKVTPLLNNPFIERLRQELGRHQDDILAIKLIYVFKGDHAEEAIPSAVLNLKEEIENKESLVRGFFGDRGWEVQFVVDITSEERRPQRTEVIDKLELRCEQKPYSLKNADDYELAVVAVPLDDLVKCYSRLGQKFLSRNIRGTLDPRKAPNRKIRESLLRILLHSNLGPDDFAFLHNGVTISASSIFSSPEGGSTTIYNPRLLNGAQTVSTVHKMMNEPENHSLFTGKNAARFGRIRVLARVIHGAGNDIFIRDITVANNQQNRVESWQLRANDQLQCELHDEFKKLGIFYSRQDGMFKSYTDEDREREGITESRDIEIKMLGQTIMAINGALDKITDMTSVFDSDKMYNKVFAPKLLKCDLRIIILAYKLHRLLPRLVEGVLDQMPEKHKGGVKKSGKYIAWALAIQWFLNHRNREHFLNKYGVDMVHQRELGAILQEEVARKVARLFKSILAKDYYAGDIELGKYNFLRTNSFFKRCMEETGKTPWKHYTV
ncbi:MAG: AIPR family protein [Candidatus Sumerlaeia bacterium]|nr:AIPR family protein [Candidatus Sumerlaeia bacterium]